MISTRESTSKTDSMLADPLLLERIDKLFACNVGEYISLPQLVVVGDQSSGKSSVLEGLTKLSFPRDSGLCTRFATQIIFRRDTNLKERVISVSIIPDPNLGAGEVEKMRDWKVSGAETLGQERFVSMMMEVYLQFLYCCHVVIRAKTDKNLRSMRLWGSLHVKTMGSRLFPAVFFACRSADLTRSILALLMFPAFSKIRPPDAPRRTISPWSVIWSYAT